MQACTHGSRDPHLATLCMQCCCRAGRCKEVQNALLHPLSCLWRSLWGGLHLNQPIPKLCCTLIKRPRAI